MLAAVYRGPGSVDVDEVPTPSLKRGEVLVKVLVAGVCGTDAAEYRDGPHLAPLHKPHPITGHVGPMIPGHEFVGVIEDPADSSFARGQRVVTGAGISCGQCPRCREGRTNLCQRYSTVGIHRDGGLAQYCAVPAAICLPVLDNIPTDVAAMTQPMAIATHAASRGKVSPGERVLIVGAGGIGMFITRAVAATGVETVVMEPDAARRELASTMGATCAVGLEHAADLVGSFDAVFEVSGTEPGLRTALDAARYGGRLILVGLHHHPSPPLAEVALRELDLIGTMALVFATDVGQALDVLSSDPNLWVDIAPTVFPLDELGPSLKRMTSGAPDQVKNLFDPWISTARAFQPTPPRRDES